MSLTVSELTPDALPEIRAALLAAKLPAAELTPGAVYYRFADESGRTVGFGGLEGRREDRLLRSLVVLPEFRGAGLGVAMVRELEGFARNAGAKTLHLLTTTAAPFFGRLGWEPRDRMAAPVDIAVTTEFSSLCPKTARYLVKGL